MTELQKYNELTEEDKNDVYDLLTSSIKYDASFVCPILDVPLSAPCSLNECGNHINNEWSKNCVLCYMHKEGLQKLSPIEVAYLLKVPETEIIELYNTQMRKVRKKYLLEELADKNSLKYLTNIDVCCVCDCKTNSDIIRNGLKFCSTTCMKNRPLYIFDIEREYGSDIETIMKTAMNLFKTIDILESLFKISRKKVEFIIRNFANSLSTQFFNMISANKDFLIKKEKKLSPCLKTLSVMGSRRKQFGNPRDSLESVFGDLNDKILSI